MDVVSLSSKEPAYLLHFSGVPLLISRTLFALKSNDLIHLFWPPALLHSHVLFYVHKQVPLARAFADVRLFPLEPHELYLFFCQYYVVASVFREKHVVGSDVLQFIKIGHLAPNIVHRNFYGNTVTRELHYVFSDDVRLAKRILYELLLTFVHLLNKFFVVAHGVSRARLFCVNELLISCPESEAKAYDAQDYHSHYEYN